MSTTAASARGAVWTIGSSILVRALSVVGTLVLVHFVVPADYGEASAASVVVGTINQFTTLGVGIYVITNRSATREDLFHATVIHSVLGLLALVACLTLAKPLSPLFGTPELYEYVPGLALSALVDRITFMPERVLIRGLKFRRVSIVRSLAEIVYTGASLAAAIAGFGGTSIVIGNVARSAVRAVGMLGSVNIKEWLSFGKVRWEIIRRISSYGLAVSLSGFANMAARRWDNLLVSRIFGPAVMGAYNLAYNLADLPAVQIGEQIADVLQASYAHMSGDERRRSLVRSFGVIGLVTFPVAVGLGAVAPTLASLFLEKKWVGTGSMLLVLCLLSISRPIISATFAYSIVERGPRLFVPLEWATVVLMMGLILTIGRISPIWTCVAVGIAFFARAFAGLVIAAGSAGVKTTAFLRSLTPPLLACIPLALAVFGTRALLVRYAFHPVGLRLILEIVAGGLAYAAAGLLVAPASARDLLRLVRQKRKNTPAPLPTSP